MAERITAVARRFGLSRSALIHYDRLGLLRPSGRSAAGHRLYLAADLRRLDRICAFRKLGVSLDDVAQLLKEPGDAPERLLRLRARQIDLELERLTAQRTTITRLLRGAKQWADDRLDKATWVDILRRAGLDDAAMWRWHEAFEASAPQAHQAFLESLGIPRPELRRIRLRSRRR